MAVSFEKMCAREAHSSYSVLFITGGGRIVDPGSTIRRTDGYKSGVSEKKIFFPS